MLLTDEEKRELINTAPCRYDLVENVIAAYEAKLREQQEPVAEVDKDDYNQWADVLPNVSVKVGDKLYLHPAPIPEGWTLVPTDIIDEFPGINQFNYNHDDVCTLNDWAIELTLAARSE